MKISPFKTDWLAYAPILIMVLVVFEVAFFVRTSDKILSSDKKCAVIVVNGAETHRIKLSEPQDIFFDGVHIEIKSGRVFFCASDCKDQNCVKGGKISRVGSTLACLPKNIVIQVVKAEE